MISSWGQWGQGITEEGFAEREKAYAISLQPSNFCERFYREVIAKIEEKEEEYGLSGAAKTAREAAGGSDKSYQLLMLQLQQRRDEARSQLDVCLVELNERMKKAAEYRKRQKAHALEAREARMRKAEGDLLPQTQTVGFPPVMKFGIVGVGILALVGVGIVAWRQVR